MFRTAASQTSKLPLWKVSAPCYSTEAGKGLADRLGAGRGKVASDTASDPFASFFARKDRNERRPRQDKPRGNGIMSFKDKDNQQKNNRMPVAGQFDDHSEDNTTRVAQKAENSFDRAKRSFNRPRDNERKPMNRKPNVRHEAIRTNRATSFIDRDIDWNSLDVMPVKEVVTVEGQQVEVEDDDYMAYFSAGAELKWSDIVRADSVRTLLATNPSLDLQQKTLFLGAVANVTSSQRVVANRQ
ncbi:hypothetical protein BY458DRAFT_502653 [Sporodiniella umbellata]|nr:hypothetical protein BY458DRAFT_502653 [Sporodiniella umbellata]